MSKTSVVPINTFKVLAEGKGLSYAKIVDTWAGLMVDIKLASRENILDTTSDLMYLVFKELGWNAAEALADATAMVTEFKSRCQERDNES